MGKVALMAIATFTVMAGYYGINAQRGMQSTGSSISQHQHEIIARNAALAGYQRAQQQLARDYDDTAGFSGSYGSASYTVEVVHDGAAGELRSATAHATYTSPGGEVKTYTITSKYRQAAVSSTGDEVPPFMKHVLITGDDLTVDGDVTLDTMKVDGSEESQYNANIHTNGSLTVKGGAASVRGFGTYVGFEDVKFEEKTFKPYHNPAGEPVLEKVAPIAIPALDAADMATKAGADESVIGPYTLTDRDYRADGATREDPHVVYVDGDLDASGSVTLSGYVMFIVRGSITFSGNVQVGTHEGPGESNFAFYAQDDIEIKGTVDVLNGQLFAGRDFILSGTPMIAGNAVVGRTATLNGTPDMLYLPASPALTKIFEDSALWLQLVGYTER